MSKLRIEEAGYLSRIRSLEGVIRYLCNRHHARIHKRKVSRGKEDGSISFILKGSRRVLKKILLAIKKDERFGNKAKFLMGGENEKAKETAFDKKRPTR